MNHSMFEGVRGFDPGSGIIYRCANCCSTLLHNGSENKGIAKLKIKNNHSDVFSEIQIWYALEFIYGVSWKSIKNQLELENRNSWLNLQEEITFCNNCASLLTENYNSHQNFEDSCHSTSLVKEFQQISKSLTSLKDSDTPQDEIDGDEKTTLFDDFGFHDEADYPIVPLIETKYDPSDDINSRNTSSADLEESNASSRRESLRSHQLPIKEEGVSDEEVFSPTNERSTKQKRFSSRKIRTRSCDKNDLSKNVTKFDRRSTQVTRKKRKTYIRVGENPKCNICGRVVKSKQSLRYHKIYKHASQEEKNKWRTTCECGVVVYSWALKAHIAKTCANTPREKLKCHQCGMEYASKLGLDDHLSTHSEEPKQCDICSKVFLTSRRLLDHKKSVHIAREKKFACTKCPEVFVFKSQLDKHQVCHEQLRKYVCEECGKSFKRSNHFRTHLKCHKEIQEKGEGAFTCDICNDGKRFAHSKSVYNHKLLKHGTKIYQCSFCGKQLSCGTNLRQHEALHKESPNFNPRAEIKERRSRKIILSELPSTKEII